MLKGANLFLFDEPTSYLDIKQRVNVSQFIASLATPETAVTVIEHDLVILDYVTEYLNIMYGYEGAFGIVSGLKATREGINAFLDGYLKEENMRFRNHPLKFEKVQDLRMARPVKLLTWNNLQKTLGNFHFSTEQGTLYKNEIIGILGENGMGKTTFMKMLAGVISADSGEVDSSVKVSYKPQYLETASEVMVGDFLQRARDRYQHQLIVPLDLEKLFAQKLSELSGGQLQRLAIANCLSQDADLFLLDEPSAYLDVEQRLLIAKVLKSLAREREVSVLVIDHDLMFLDYLSDRLLVFSGTPAREGVLRGPFSITEGMNSFLKELDITLRRDHTTLRPRINKKGSVKDREQRVEGKWYGG